MPKSWDIVDENISIALDTSRYLFSLSESFYMTGNHILGEKLEQEANTLHKAVIEIQNAYRKERMVHVDQSIKNGERFIGSILKGILDGKDPKDTCIEASKHHLDNDLINAHNEGK